MRALAVLAALIQEGRPITCRTPKFVSPMRAAVSSHIVFCLAGVAYGQLPCVTPYQSAAKNADLTHVAKAMEVRSKLSRTYQA